MSYQDFEYEEPDDFSDGDEFDDGYPQDDEFPDDEFSDDDAAELLPCPECGEAIYEEAERCPYCGAYVVFSTGAWSGRPLWWVVLGLLGAAAVVYVFLRS